MLRWVWVLCVLLCTQLFAQRDDVGSGRALSFDGINDYVSYGNILDELAVPFTISAWINLSQNVTDWAPIFVSQDNGPIYNGVTFIVKPDQLCISYGDGRGELNPQFRRTIVSDVGNIAEKWVHVTGIIRSATSMELYVNGVPMPGGITGFSDQPMSSSPSDIAKSGLWLSNGLTFRYKGMIDEIRIWNRALTIAEIRNSMCLKAVAADLIALWSFNEIAGDIVRDDSPNHFEGVLLNGVTRVYSGAAIGDKSISNYSITASTNVKLQEDNEFIIVDNLSNATGVQLYAVRSMPSLVGGLPMSCIEKPYFGVFVAQSAAVYGYDLEYTSPQPYRLFTRKNNADDSWTTVITIPTGPNSISANGLNTSIETLDGPLSIAPDLGPDLLVCEDAPVEIDPGIDESGIGYLWNTGAQTPSIVVTKPGIYWVDVTEECGQARDSIIVGTLPTPAHPFIAGDSIICDGSQLEIESEIVEATAYRWSTGATTRSIVVSAPGIYWLDVTKCGTSRDTLVVGTLPTPGISFDDEEICSATAIELVPVSETGYESLQWQDGSDGDSLLASTSGIYWVTAMNRCGAATDSIKVNINDVKFTPPNVITPNGDNKNDAFVIDSEVGNVQLKIFNRWGLEVYSTSNYKNDWTGQGIADGVYYYIMTHGCSVDFVKGVISVKH